MLKWTNKPPTKPGFYFLRWNRGGIRVVEVWGKSELSVWGRNVNTSIRSFENCNAQWAGPIPKPEEEK